MATVEEKKTEENSEDQYQFAFKLKSGSHYDGKRHVTIEPGQIYHTNVDMAKLQGRDRWEKLKDHKEESIDDLRARIRILEGMVAVQDTTQEIAPPVDDLEAKSVKELRALAASMEPPVDLTDCTGKAEIVNAIRSAMDAA